MCLLIYVVFSVQLNSLWILVLVQSIIVIDYHHLEEQSETPFKLEVALLFEITKNQALQQVDFTFVAKFLFS